MTSFGFLTLDDIGVCLGVFSGNPGDQFGEEGGNFLRDRVWQRQEKLFSTFSPSGKNVFRVRRAWEGVKPCFEFTPSKHDVQIREIVPYLIQFSNTKIYLQR